MRSNRLAVAGGLGGALTAGWGTTSLGGVIPQLADTYGVSVSTIGLLTTLAYAANMALQIPAGRLVDRFGSYRVVVAGAAVILVANLVAVAAPSFALAIVSRLTLGAGTALVFVSAISFLRESVRSPVMQGLFGAFNGLGALALAVVPLAEHALGWRAAFVTSAVIAGLTLAILLRAPHPRRPARRAVDTESVRLVLSDRSLYRLAVTTVVPIAFGLVVSSWLATLLVETYGYGSSAAGALAALAMVAGIVTRPFGGWLVRRGPDTMRRVLALGMATGSLATITMCLTSALVAVVLAALAIGLASGIPFAIGYGSAPRVRPSAPGAAVSLTNMIALAAVVSGIPLVGLTFSLPGGGRIGLLAVAAAWLLPIGLLRGTVAMLEERDVFAADLEPRAAGAPVLD